MKKNKFLINIPFIILFIVINVIFLNTKFIYDDIYYGSVLNDYSLIDFLSFHWHNWSSRLVLETLEIIFTSIHIYYLRIMNSLMFVLLAYSISKIFFKKRNLENNILSCLSVLLIPIYLLHTAGWGSTSVVYLWSLSLGLFAFIPIVNNIRGKHTSLLYYFLSYIFLLVGLNQEQMCCLVLGFSIITLIILLKDKKKIAYNISIIIFAIISLIIVYICPGNAVRLAAETAAYYPEYANFNIFHKIYLGIIPTMNSLIQNKYLIVLLLTSITYSIFKNNNKKVNKYISIITLIFVLLLTFFRNQFVSSFRFVDNLFYYFEFRGVPSISLTPSSLYALLPVIISIIVFIIVAYLILIVFKNDKYKYVYSLLWLGGIASRFMLGFSASVFESNERTAFYMFFIMIVLSVKIIKDIKIKKDEINIPFIMMIVFIIINIISLILENGLMVV